MILRKCFFILIFFSSYAGAIDLNELDSFFLKEMNFDIAQGNCKTKFADEELYNVVMTAFIRDEFSRYREVSKGESPPVDIYINADVLNCSYKNTFQYNIRGVIGSEKVIDYSSPSYVASFLKVPARLSVNSEQGNVLGALVLSEEMISSISDITSGFYLQRPKDSLLKLNDTYVDVARLALKRIRTDYIPKNEFDHIYKALEDEDRKVRIKAFDGLTRTWLYSDKLRDDLTAYLNILFLEVEKGGDDKEFRHLLNSIASFGDSETLFLLKSFLENKNLSYKLRKHISNYAARYVYKAQFFSSVHSVGKYNSQFSWKENQLYNRLGLDSNKEVAVAVREVRDNYLDNAFLVSRAASILESDFKVNGKKSDERFDVHSLILKLIEKSGNSDFLGLVSMVERKARSEKVLGYAKSTRKKLAKIKKKEEKLLRKNKGGKKS